MTLEELSTKELLTMIKKMDKRLKFLEGVEAERKKQKEYEDQCCDECGIIPDDSGNCMCDEDDDDDYHETDYDREGV